MSESGLSSGIISDQTRDSILDELQREGQLCDAKDAANARQYAEQLQAHMDEGGTYSSGNVRDLIRFVLMLSAPTPIRSE